MIMKCSLVFSFLTVIQVTDIVYFIIIMTVFVCAYGFARFSILFQESVITFTNITEKNIIRKLFVVPFYEVLGDTFIDLPPEGRVKRTNTRNPVEEFNNSNRALFLIFSIVFFHWFIVWNFVEFLCTILFT